MSNNPDHDLIKKYIDWCEANNFTQTKMGELAGRTKQWASWLVNGHISKLQFKTRGRIKSILGIQ